VKANLWVRDFMPKSDQKHEKTKLKLLQKKKTINPLDILSKKLTISA
jgi:hypothetical protein